MALIGDLKELKLPSLIQLNCMERNTAKLTIDSNDRFGIIYFRDGQIIHAEYKPDIGEKAVFRMLGLKSGKFKVENGIECVVQTIKMNWNNLLLEGLQYVDEAQESEPHSLEYLTERLLKVKGIKALAILDEEGSILGSEGELKSRQELLSEFTIHESRKISAIVKEDMPQFVSISNSTYNCIIMKYNNVYFMLLANEKIKLDLILPALKEAVA